QRPGANPINLWTTFRYFDSLQKTIQPDCVISTGGHGYWKPKGIPVVGGFNIPHYIYPESPYFNGMTFKKRLYWKLMRTFHFYFYKRLDTIFVQTDDVNNRLQKIVPRSLPIVTISNTVNAVFYSPKTVAKQLPEPKLNEIRLLTLSSYYPHKNIAILKKVIPLLQQQTAFDFKFVLTLEPEKYNELFTSEEQEHIYNVGKVPIDACPGLYAEVDFLFLPTLLECFSASYAEAMLMQKPILTSDLPFAHTVCKDAALYFDPMNPELIAQKIVALATDEMLQNELIARGNEVVTQIPSAANRAERFLELCKSTLAHKKNA
ncbi:MAG: glycosyltransferase family 4 protein, partial [Flavobacterium sp.]|nr:glycosyltransferase family 4 protein [Flavobacterium sp.]